MLRRTRHPLCRPRITGLWLGVVGVFLLSAVTARADCGWHGMTSAQGQAHFDRLVVHRSLEGVPTPDRRPPVCTGAFCSRSAPADTAELVPSSWRPDPLADMAALPRVAPIDHVLIAGNSDCEGIGRRTSVERPPRPSIA